MDYSKDARSLITEVPALEDDNLIRNGTNGDEQDQEDAYNVITHVSAPHSSDGEIHQADPTLRSGRHASNNLDANAKGHPSMYLKTSYYTLYLVLGYSLLSILSWTLICVAARRPLGLPRYGYDRNNTDADYSTASTQKGLATYFRDSEHSYRLARTTQSIVALLTIPLTSAVCSVAAVTYIQRDCASRLTLRQTMVLADKGWLDPQLWLSLLRTRRKRYWSSMLAVALILHILGGTIAPLTQVLLGSKTILALSKPRRLQGQSDIIDHFEQPEPTDNNFLTLLTRASLTSASPGDIKSRLWETAPQSCLLSFRDWAYQACEPASLTLLDFHVVNDPFLAQPAVFFDTGLIRGFVPRINSTAEREYLDQGEFPSDCASAAGAFYAEYTTPLANGDNWTIQACMPGDMTKSPWRRTRERQDFSETLFVNITINPEWIDNGIVNNLLRAKTVFKIGLNTTAGFFELPNNMNGNLPGPLLSDDPKNHCGLDCGQIFSDITAERDTASDQVNSLEQVRNKGPLLTTALAVFGNGSYFQQQLTRAADMAQTNDTEYYTGSMCDDIAPMQSLLLLGNNRAQGNVVAIGNSMFSIVRDNVGLCMNKSVSIFDINQRLADYVSLFVDNADWLMWQSKRDIAFTAAAFLANEAWLTNSPSGSNMTLMYDPGSDTVIPVISKSGIIVISIFLAIYLCSLLALAAYSSRIPHWTDRLDSFAMMRIAHSVRPQLPLHIGFKQSEISLLDETPGTIGDATEHAAVGTLALGAKAPLRARRRYKSFEVDDEPYPRADAASKAQ